jgi:hypothetical protein
MKGGMDSCRLHALAFNYLDLFFRQPVKLVDQGVYLSVCGLYLTLEAGLLMRYTKKLREGIKMEIVLGHFHLFCSKCHRTVLRMHKTGREGVRPDAYPIL